MVKVLVVDDDPDIRLLVRRLLRILNCESLEAPNGIEAEQLVWSENPDIILLDIMMPIQDGYETCVHLRAKGYSGLIIMVSALKEETEKTKTHNAGADAYIQKPITKEVLTLHINHARSQIQA